MILSIFKDMDFGTAILVFIAYAFAIVFALVAHEYMHSWTAVKQGDLTPKAYGRLTLNPAKHFDVVGLLCFVLVGFGWAKPVPINTLNFYNHKKGVILVSLAGIITNLIISFVAMAFLIITNNYLMDFGAFSILLYYLFYFCTVININLAIFNLLPIYPLDGFNFLNAFVRYDNKFVGFMMQYGWLILIMLMLSGALGWLINFVGGFVFGIESAFWQLIF